MKRTVLAVLVGAAPWTSSLVLAQEDSTFDRFIHCALGLGVDLHAAPSIIDYINTLVSPPIGSRLTNFSSATEFFIAPEARMTRDLSVAVEYTYFLKSYSLSDVSGFSAWNFSYTVQMPTLLVHYVVPGTGYWLKFGGGAGYAAATFTQKNTGAGSEQDYHAKGGTIVADAVADTEFDPHFFGNIGVEMRYCYAGNLTNSAGAQPAYASTRARMDYFSVGARFGVLFQL